MVLVAIGRLVTQLLNRVGRAFNEEPSLPKTVENERVRIAAALQSVALFFGKGGLDQPFADRFDQLASFIEDLNRGARSDLLTLPKGSGYRDSAETHKARAYLVFAIDALMKSGKTADDAARHIVRQFPDVTKLIHGRANKPWDTLLEWKKKGLPHGKLWQQNVLNELRQEIDKVPNGQLIVFAGDLVARAAGIAFANIPASTKPPSRKQPKKRPHHDGKGRFEAQ